jgi:uncharacterized membrane protein
MSQTASWLQQFGHEVEIVEHRVLDAIRRIPHLKHDHPPVENVNEQFRESFTPMERVALGITQHVGSFGFFLILVGWSVIWLLWNTLAPRSVRFDPAPAFVLWLFISNMVQITLMPLIMVGQNLLNRHSELRAEQDFQINIKAERETATVLLHLEHQAAQIERQGELILEILHRLETAEQEATATRGLTLQIVQRMERSGSGAPAHEVAPGGGSEPIA